MRDETYEVLIVGSGPAGLAAGVRAARKGLKHVILERGAFASTIHRYRRGKWVMAEPTSVALHPDMELEFEAESREVVLERWARDCQRAGVQILSGGEYEVLSVEGSRGSFAVQTRGGRTFFASNVVLAIGTAGAPRPFGVPGDSLPHVAFEIEDASTYVDQQIVVVGAGDSAIEDALALAENDNEVVLIQRRSGFDRAKPANKSAIEAAMRAGDVTVYSHTSPRRFEPGEIVVATQTEELCLPCDLVIGRLGARPPRAFLESIGIEFDSADPEALPSVSESYESNIPGIYLVGELAGRPLIKYCMNQGYEVIDHILGVEVRSAEEPALLKILEPLQMDVDQFVQAVRKRVPLLSDLTRRQIESWLADSRIHRLRAGDLIYQDGDFGETFFTVLEGAVEVLRDPFRDENGARADTEPILLREGEFFGEDSLLSGRGRCETVVTMLPSILIESSRTAVLRLANSVTRVSDALDHAWAIRKLGALLPMLDHEQCIKLAERAELKVHPAGGTLFKEGDPADGLYLIRRGSVVVSRERSGDDRVVNYVTAGSILGEFALVRPSMERTATVRATVRTETLRIPTEVILEITEHYPELRSEYRRRWREHSVRDEQVLASPGSTSLLDFVIAKGGKEATDMLFIDEALCIRCDNCEKACAATHSGVSRLDREAGSRYAGIHMPTSCQHCENALCMTDCPPESIQRHPDGEIYIEDTCIGCGNCAAYCPYGVIQMTELHDDRPPSLLRSILFGSNKRRRARRSGGGGAEVPTHDVAVKCDLCRDLKHRTEGSPVACVSACPTGAIARIQPFDLLDRLTIERPRGYSLEDRGSSYAARDAEKQPEPAAAQPVPLSPDALLEQARELLAKSKGSGAAALHPELAAALRELAGELESAETPATPPEAAGTHREPATSAGS